MKIHKVLNGPGQWQVLTIRNYLNNWIGILALLLISSIIKHVCVLLTNHSSHLTFLNLTCVFCKIENINLLR